MSENQSFCLLCYSSLAENERKSHKKVVRPVGDNENTLLEKQLNVIFVLTKLLDVPISTCQTFLQRGEGNPSEWFRCCQHCSKFIKLARTNYTEMCKIMQRFTLFKNEARRKLQKSNGRQISEDLISKSKGLNQDIFLEEIRAHLYKKLGLHKSNLTLAYQNADIEESYHVKTEPDLGVEDETIISHFHDDNGNAFENIDDNSDFFEHNASPDNEGDNSGNEEMTNERNDSKIDTNCKIAKLDKDVIEEKISYRKRRWPRKNTKKLRNYSEVEQNDETTTDGKTNSQKDKSVLNESDYSDWNTSEHSEGGKKNQDVKVRKRKRLKRKRDNHIKCALCPKIFHVPSALKDHQRGVHYKELNLNPHICVECNKTFKCNRNLLNHNRKIHKRGFKRFCDICNMGVATTTDLELHKQKVHKKEVPFVCHLCGKTSATKYLLQRHMETHNKHLWEIIKCDECEKEFRCKRTYGNHKRIVHFKGPKPFVCELCGASFPNNTYFSIHQRTKHLKELNLEPFKCKFCGMVFGSVSVMYHHEKSEHVKDWKFVCPVEECKKGFYGQRRLDDHIQSCHNGQSKRKDPPVTFMTNNISFQ